MSRSDVVRCFQVSSLVEPMTIVGNVEDEGVECQAEYQLSMEGVISDDPWLSVGSESSTAGTESTTSDSCDREMNCTASVDSLEGTETPESPSNVKATPPRSSSRDRPRVSNGSKSTSEASQQCNTNVPKLQKNFPKLRPDFHQGM